MPPKSCQLEMAKYVADLQKATNVEKFSAFLRANLFFKLGNRIADLVGNAGMGVAEMGLKQPMASLIDRKYASPAMARVRSKAEGRTVTPGEVRVRMFSPRDVVMGVRKGLPAGFRDMGQTLRTGTSAVDLNRAADQIHGEVVYETPYIGKPLTLMVNGVMRMVQATDRPAFWTRFHNALQEQARIKGSQQGLAGPELEAYIQRATSFATDERGFLDQTKLPLDDTAQMDAMAAGGTDGLRYLNHEDATLALHDAYVAVFQDDSTASKALGGLKRGMGSGFGKFKENPAGRLAAEILFPVVKTPSNAAQRIAEYTPGVGMAMGYANMRRAFRAATNGDTSQAKYLQQYAVDQMARSSAGGVGAVMVGIWLHERGLLSLNYPKDAGEQGRWEAENRQENSIRIGNEWLTLEKMAPFGALLVVGGYANQAWEETQTQNAMFPQQQTGLGGRLASTAGGAMAGGLGMMGGIARISSDQPAFTGAEMIAGAFSGDRENGLTDWVGQTAASFMIPGIVGSWAQWTDPVQRERYLEEIAGQRVPEALRKPLGTIAARIPMVSEGLPARHDVLGNSVDRNEGGWEGFYHAFIDPFNSKLDKSTQDRVTQELNRLDVGITRLTPQGAERQNREVFYLRRERYGVMLRGVLAEVIQSNEYQGIAEARRWMASNVPGISRLGIEKQIQAEQRAFLEDAIDGVRDFIRSERKKGEFSDDVGVPEGVDEFGNEIGRSDNLPNGEEESWTVENAVDRTLDKAWDRVSDIEDEPIGVPFVPEQ